MIAIIADDFTGAAELAGISLRYGLKAALCTGEVSATDADVWIVSTDSRSLNRKDALQKTEEVLKQVLRLKPGLIYKKIDSVLRGYVLDELKLQMKCMQKTKALILPANPSLGRTISDGMYFVQGVPISKTGFAADPEFPISSSLVKSILKGEEVQVLKHSEVLPAEGIMVGEASCEEDVKHWAGKADEHFVLAGAGDFFAALLELMFQSRPPDYFDLQLPLLYVCGTAFGQSVHYVEQVHHQSDVVIYISKGMINQMTVDAEWLRQCGEILHREGKAILAFKSDLIPPGIPAVELRNLMAKAVRAMVEQQAIRELFIEGGSTAMAILKELNIVHLLPVNELKRGVVRMKAGSMFVTVKPGSYALPDEIKEQFGN